MQPTLPAGPNDPTAILAAWIALEALSPQTYRRPEDLVAGDRRCVIDLSDEQLPWLRGERSRPNYRLYYQVVLGAIPMDRATEDLIKVFGEDQEIGRRPREKSAIAAVLLDKDGKLLDENAVGVSSFAWALPKALQGDLAVLGSWPSVEQGLIANVEARVRRTDTDGKPLALDMATIQTTHRWLVDHFGLPGHLVEKPFFALRVFHYYKARNPPEVALLNSFFINDLARCSELVRQGAAPAGLKGYLGIDRPKHPKDLLQDNGALEAAVAPEMMPAAQWPAPGHQPLVLLQQAAVNLARSELSAKDGILAVNGPPGTGKTTLLRDLVAACVLDRALALAAFETPEEAFSPSGEKLAVGEGAFFHLYKLHPSLRGHEVLVASSNNKAVENISKELPARDAVGRDLSELSYFRSISDIVHAPGDDRQTEESDLIEESAAETWGLIAAVLGNAKNRALFQRRFWWHEDFAFRLYLKAAKGDDVVRQWTDDDGTVQRRTPRVVHTERPPVPQQARANWADARRKLLQLKQVVDSELAALEQLRRRCTELVKLRPQVERDEAALIRAIQRHREQQQLVAQRKEVRDASEHVLQGHLDRLHQHRRNRPGFFSRLFGSARWKAWEREHGTLRDSVAAAEAEARNERQHLSKAESLAKSLLKEADALEGRVSPLKARLASLEQTVHTKQHLADGRLLDESVMLAGHDALHRLAPWLSDRLHAKREELFIAALAAHRAFIDMAPQKVLHNLSAMMLVLSQGAFQDDAKRALLGDLWATLFLVVPVLSTTFASVDRMLGQLPPQSLGWLLIDEAGQALPQAAVGAIMRARRAVVVGDPIQIPPVVTLPEVLNAKICEHFNVSRATWSAPEASAQTLADAASRWQAEFRSDQGPRRVGVPLLVHRRCLEPMFSIVNQIAYDGQMVFATPPVDDRSIGTVLGASKWLDIDGAAESKWCPAEGDVVISLLRMLSDAGVSDPDLFVITPFRIVAQELRRRVEGESALMARFGVDVRQWTLDRIGTIHTVQGRAADSVIVVLGAPNDWQASARSWAANTPNILNVAVSRARANLYVIGSYGAWSGVGYARVIANTLPRVRL